LGYKDKDFAKIKISLIPDGLYTSKIVALDDGPLPRSPFLPLIPCGLRMILIRAEDVIYDRLSEKLGKEYIGLDHPDRSPNRKPGFGEKALTIKS
jgi:hypothetical protein